MRSSRRPILLFLLLAAVACAPDAGVGPAALAKGRPAPPPPPPPPPPPGGVCDFNPTEPELTGPDWTRVFNEDFSGDLSQWSTWIGGAWNEELQLYQAGVDPGIQRGFRRRPVAVEHLERRRLERRAAALSGRQPEPLGRITQHRGTA